MCLKYNICKYICKQYINEYLNDAFYTKLQNRNINMFILIVGMKFTFIGTPRGLVGT